MTLKARSALYRILKSGKNMKTIFKLLVTIFATTLINVSGYAGQQDSELILKSGDYTAELESRFAWTLHKLHYKDNPILVPSGWMGTVIKCKVPKGKDPFTGTGHGGEELKLLKVTVDGKVININSRSQIIKGKIIRVVKHSKIGPLKHISTLTLTPAGLKQSYDFEVDGDASSLLNMYLFMSIWSKPMERWLACSMDGKISSGNFVHNNKFIQTGMNKWVALLDPKSGIAGICVYKLPQRHKSFFWDRRVDNKHYIKYYPRKRQGFKFSCESFVSVFQTTPDKFKVDAKEKAAEIDRTKKEYKQPSKDLVLAREKAILKAIKSPLNFKIEYPVVKSKVINAVDFGLREGADAKVNAVALQKAVDYCKRNNINKLIIPKGRYHFLKSGVDKRDSDGDYNHYTGRIFTINLIGMRDFILDGQGAEFIFEDIDLPRGKEILGAFFRVLECERVQIKNLTLDWNWDKMPLGFIGQITNVDREKLTVDYKVSYNKKAIPKDFHVYAVRGWDPEINNRTTKNFEFYWRIAKSHRMIGPNTLRFTFNNNAQISKAKKGMWAIFKSKTHFFACGIIADDNKNLSIDNVKIYGAPSSAINARKNEKFEIVNCKVMPRPGTEKVWASHSGFEVHNSKGGFKMENNYLEFTHDDTLHFSDYFFGSGFDRINKSTLNIKGLMYWQAADTFVIGDSYEFRNRDYSPTGFKAKLKKFKWNFVNGQGQGKHFVTAVFDQEIPESIKEDSIIYNVSSYGKGQYFIRNNTIKNGLCHGLYIGTPNGVVENNRIINTAYPALILHSVIRWTRWHIGYPPENVIIRNNYIENANTALRPPADVFVGGGVDPQKSDYYPFKNPVARNILIEGNTIKNSQWQALAVWSAQNIVVRNNSIINSNRLPNKKRYAGTIHLANVKNIVLTGNQCKDDGNAKDHGIVLQKNTCKDVFAGGNSGMELRYQ